MTENYVQDVNLSRLYYIWGGDVKGKTVYSIEYRVYSEEKNKMQDVRNSI